MTRAILCCMLSLAIFQRVAGAQGLSLATPTLGVPPAPGIPRTWSGYTYIPPEGWTATTYADGIVYASPVSETGERCQLGMLQARPVSGDLAEHTFAVYREFFKIDPRQNSSYPYPAPTLTRGTSAQGWRYFMVRKPIGGYVGDSVSLTNTFVLLAELRNRRAVIVGSSKDPPRQPMLRPAFGRRVAGVLPEPRVRRLARRGTPR